MGEFEKKQRSSSFHAALSIGLWWGLTETIRLVWGGAPSFFTWGKYLAAAGIITLASITITTLIIVPLSLFAGRRRRTENAIAIGLLVITALQVPGLYKVWITIRFFLHTGILSLLRAPGLYKFWYVLPISIAGLVAAFLLLRLMVTLFLRKYPVAIFGAITGLLIVMALILPILKNQLYAARNPPNNHLPDIILITIDNVRADHLASYGYFRQTSPFLDNMAGESVVFDNATVQINYTTGSHLSMLTSRYPADIGINRIGSQSATNITSMAKELKKEGYLTAGFVSCAMLSRNFTQFLGFDFYDDIFSFLSWLMLSNIFQVLEPAVGPVFLKKGVQPIVRDAERRANATTEATLKWLKDVPPNQPLFIWVHYFDPHEPMDPPPPYDQKFQSSPDLQTFIEKQVNTKDLKEEFNIPLDTLFRENNLYDGEIAFMDYWIEQLLIGINKYRNREDNTYLIVIADHGFSFGEHNYYFGKVKQIYDTIIQVPFFIHLPGEKARRIHQQVEAVDMMPTILDLLGMKIPPGLNGRSLAPLIRGEVLEPAPAFSETVTTPAKYSARTPDWKLICNRNANIPFELFNLANDPFEKENLFPQQDYRQLPQVQQLTRQLNDWIRENHRGQEIKMAPLSKSDIEKLRALGYLE